MANSQFNVLVLGDVSFFYDSNALSLAKEQSKLRIIVLHNGGGDIFRIIEKDNHNEGFEELLTTPIETSIKKLVEANQLNYFYAAEKDELETVLPSFFEQSDLAQVLEVDTRNINNAKVFKELFK